MRAASGDDLDAGASPRHRVLVVIGTRPEAIKLLPLVSALRRSSLLEPVVIATGQHPGVVEEVLGAEGLSPDVNLDVASPGLSLNELVGAVLAGFERFCVSRFGDQLDVVTSDELDAIPVGCLVHGDTSSAFAAALSAFHLRIPVVHIEAGLRTRSTRSPFPEELNRQLISRIAAFHVAPTTQNKENLVREGIALGTIFVSGNTAIDSLLWASTLRSPYGAPELSDLEDDEDTRVVVVTAHRRENWGSGLESIGRATARLAERYPQTRFVLPLHPNPRVAQTLRAILEPVPNVSLVHPMEYTAFARLLRRSHLVITDSGGIQEEAPALGKPVLVTRTTTERTEGVEAGTLELVGTDEDRIVEATSRLLDDPSAYDAMAARTNPYGDGHAALRIVEAFEHIIFDTPAPSPFGSSFDSLAVLRGVGFEADPRGLDVDPMTATPIAEPTEPLIEELPVT